MRITEKKDSEWIMVHVDSDDDLWYLKNLINEGDMIRMTTLRRVEKQQDMNRSKESPRKPVTASIVAESVEFQNFSGNLKVLGTIREGPEDIIGDHQSFNISPGDNFELKKQQWLEQQRELLAEALDNKFSQKFYFIAADDETAWILMLKSYGIQSIGKIDSHLTGKAYESNFSEQDFHREIVESCRRMLPEGSTIIILGPGFTREKILNAFRTYGGPGFRVVTYPTNRSDAGAVWEFLNTPETDAIFRDLRISGDSRLVESFLRHVGTDGLGTYGYEDVLKALETGAVDTLIVSEEKFRTPEGRKLLKESRNYGTRVHIIGTGTDPGRIVSNFGGYCAILRYRLP